ncbi:MAG TPA: hypothetical protein VFF67_00890 [Thermoplasmata archaeon]|nr:hypothetical protein [Thermoplasmata archaeon]
MAAGGILTIGVGLLLLTAPAASASKAMLPPFKNATWTIGNSQIYAGCYTKARWTVSPSWNNATGNGSAAASFGSKSCPPSLGGVSSALVQTNVFTISIPLHLPSGAHSVALTMKETMSGSNHVHIGGVCPAPVLANGNGNMNCDAYAQYASQMGGTSGGGPSKLWDQTTNTYVSGSPGTGPNLYNYTWDYNRTTCSSGTCTYSNYSASVSTFSGNTVSATYTAYFNSTFTNTHKYWVIVGIYLEVTGDVVGYPHSTSSSTLDMAGLGGYFAVTSIKVV